MKTVLLLRHAKSSWSNALLPDHARPLNRRGQKEATQIGALLRSEGLMPDLVLASDAERTRETLVLVTAVADYRGPTRLRGALYGGTQADYVKELAGLEDEVRCVMLIGHNPVLEALVLQLSGVQVGVKPATLVRVDLPVDSWAAVDETTRGKLAGVWQPRD